jgi:hypothetical protein
MLDGTLAVLMDDEDAWRGSYGLDDSTSSSSSKSLTSTLITHEAVHKPKTPLYCIVKSYVKLPLPEIKLREFLFRVKEGGKQQEQSQTN